MSKSERFYARIGMEAAAADIERRKATEGKLRDYEIYEAKIAALEARLQEAEAKSDRLAAEMAERERRAIDAQSECVEWRLRAEEAEAVLGRDVIREAVEAAYLGWCAAFGYDTAEFMGDLDDESDGLPGRIIEALANLIPAETKRERLAAALAESQGREQELLNRIGKIAACGAGDPDFKHSTIGQECRRALASPSPAAQAIGRVVRLAVLAEQAFCQLQAHPTHPGHRAVFELAGHNLRQEVRAYVGLPKVHRCMRCGEEFECEAPDHCEAAYEVLPNHFVVRNGEPIMVEHCQREALRSGQTSQGEEG